MRRECLDRVLILGRRHLVGVLEEFVDHYNTHRPHRSLGQASPCGDKPPSAIVELGSKQLLRTARIGGIVHEYRLVA